MNDVLSLTPNDNFFVNDPQWAVDFAPNGNFLLKAQREMLNFKGTLVKVGDTMTRKRYAE
jgi:hypothetical protein